MDANVISPCPHAGICGGCAFGGTTYEESKAQKESRVKRLLAPSFSLQMIEPEWADILCGPDIEGYRNKMEFTFGDAEKDGPLELGLHRKGRFHDIVSVPDCRIVDADFRLILSETLSFFSSFYDRKEITYYHRKRASGYLRHLLVRKARNTGDILVCLVTATPGAETLGVPEEQLLRDFRDRLLSVKDRLSGSFCGILHTVNDAKSDAIIDQGTGILFGKDSFEETLLGLRFKISPFSFFQTNSGGAAVLYETVRTYVTGALASEGPGKKAHTVYDLYCGTGTIAQILSPVAEHVTGVELVEEAVLSAKKAAAENGITNCTFLCGDVLKVLDSLAERPDVLVLDPPRSGLNPKTLPKLLSYGASHIVYVSCKPESLARDLPFFLTHGYAVTRGVCVDQFPWTEHVETVCLLGRRKPDDTIKVSVNMDDYYQIRDAEEAEKTPS